MKCKLCDKSDFKNQTVLEQPNFYVIYPKKPIFKYHLIIFPKKHSESLHKISSKESIELKDAVKTINRAATSKEYLGYNIFSNNGDKTMGQSVKHFHLHVFLRYRDEEISRYKMLNEPSLVKTNSVDEYKRDISGLRKMLS